MARMIATDGLGWSLMTNLIATDCLMTNLIATDCLMTNLIATLDA